MEPILQCDQRPLIRGAGLDISEIWSESERVFGELITVVIHHFYALALKKITVASRVESAP